jgi:molybdopterin converting factor small subunit
MQCVTFSDENFDLMEVEVSMFGELAEKAGVRTQTVDGPTDTDGLVAEMKKLFPATEGLTFIVAVNKQIIRENTPLRDGDKVVLMPPFSGG